MRRNSQRDSYAALLQEFLCTEISRDILVGLTEVRAADSRPPLRPPGESEGETGRETGETRQSRPPSHYGGKCRVPIQRNDEGLCGGGL